ncbi:sigma factor-binding protein Crl [Martelella alba]|uniref:Sigma factor-binding protein Crl n=1 Tax=Martelella alba TaxID=2590451 RepID=A0ABY2SGJ0_9HYPH|nr:sigma factor-binding protein Crl [Martelella alba]TKI03327.1 sigma factor-binding protein Crl [Martelella alba]
MAVVNGHPKSRLIKGFAALGPYLREEQCGDGHFFFDCLAVCLNMQPAPEKREFWGWWMDMNVEDGHFTYSYRLGLFDREGRWKEKKIGDPEVFAKLENTLRMFHQRLRAYLATLDMTLAPAESFKEQPFVLTS